MTTETKVILTTAEKTDILSRMFPNGTIRRPNDVEGHEETHLGYCRSGDIVEIRFWCGNFVDINFHAPKNYTKKELASELVEIALEEQDTKRSEWYQYNGKFYFYNYTTHGIQIVFSYKKRQLHSN